MRVEIQIFDLSQEERQTILENYDNRLAVWMESDPHMRGDMPEKPMFQTRFCPGKVDVSDLISFYIVKSELIRIETKHNYYTIKYDELVLHQLETLIPG